MKTLVCAFCARVGKVLVLLDGGINQFLRNLKELESRIKEAVSTFNETQKEFVNNLYKSMPPRLCDVILRHGERLKY